MVFCCRISFFNENTLKYTFYSATEIEIKKTWKKFTQTALIKLPKNLGFIQNNQVIEIDNLSDFIKIGDRVIIELGYNTILKKEFEGYVSEPIKTAIPYEIYCEDEMWKLKQKMVSVAIEDATVKQILEAAAPDYKIYCADELYGDFSQVDTPVKIFETLRKKLGVYTFFRDKRLVCGLQYVDPRVSDVVPKFVVGENILDFDIKVSKDENTKLKVYGRAHQKDGSVIFYDKGDEGGAITKLEFHNYINKEQLKQAVENKYKREIELGSISGSFKTFGFPFVEHGQKMYWHDAIKEKIKAYYYIDEINIECSLSAGYKKTIVPGQNYKIEKIK